uniref:Uncharacterized protein n=1 Tax=Physcomitrium patens TaxID=3218 RepID=A0A2K1IA14_PHYPA|nr:hypothetical protein PHYPA_031109 [Physcomitrium patens]
MSVCREYYFIIRYEFYFFQYK